MKRILLLMILSCFGAVGFAQTLVDGDYRTAKNSGNWSDADMWERRNGGTWSVTATLPTASNNVYVQAGHTVTVDAANVSVKDLQVNTTGVLSIGVNVINVNGKIRAFTDAAVTGSSDGVYTTNATAPTAASITTSTGYLNFVGTTRTIAAAGEWSSTGTTNSARFSLDANAVGTFVTGFKFKNIEISSGTVASDGFISPVDTYITIKSGAKLSITRSGLIIANNSTTKTGTFTIENGATLELSGSSPTMAVTDFINNGTVVYNRAGSQNFLAAGGDATATTNIHNYKILELSLSNSKTLTSPITVSQLLKISGTAAIVPSVVNTLTMLNNSTVERNVTSGTSIPSTAGFVFYGTTPSDIVNVTIGNVLDNGSELPSAPTPGAIGTLTISPSAIYTIKGTRTFGNLVNNGVLVLSPSSTMTLNINGDLSGAGTITGNIAASLNFQGANNGNAGILRFTSGSENLNRLTINRSGTNPSLNLGTSLSLNENLYLTTGVLNVQPGVVLTMNGANTFNGSSTDYINTQSAGASIGKIVINGLTASKVLHMGSNGHYLPLTLVPTAASNFDINVFAGATADATPNGTALTAAQKARMVDAVWNINRTAGAGNVDVTLGWDNTLEGADFAGFGNAQIGIASYVSGAYGTFAGSGNASANTATLTTSTFSPFVVGEANTTLPLTLISFTAKESLNSVKLAWQTTSEVNLKNYVLQHRTANGFQDIYTVTANNKEGVFNYSYTHLNPVAGANYYRLVGVDLDGTQHTSDVKAVNVAFNTVSVYPNPVSQRNISVSGLVKGDIIRLLNIQGQVIATKTASGNQAEEVDVQNIQAGTYILSVENSGKITSTKKVIKI